MNEQNMRHIYEDNLSADTALGRAVFNSKSLGQLNLPTGSVIAGDPFTFSNDAPFKRKVKPGAYDVRITIARFEDDGDERTAFATILFSAERPVDWAPAVYESLEDGEEYDFFNVDSGTGFFIDKKNFEAYVDFAEDEKRIEKLMDRMELAYVDTWAAVNYALDPDKKVNMALFSTGLGDGSYDAWFGLDQEGKVCCLTVDMGLFEQAEEEGEEATDEA